MVADIRANPGTPWTIRDMTDRLHVSEATLARLTAKRYSMSPLRLVIHIRMSAASQLLVTTDKTVAEIAGHVGYQRSSAFTRLFIRHVGMSPGKYRKQAREQGVVE